MKYHQHRLIGALRAIAQLSCFTLRSILELAVCCKPCGQQPSSELAFVEKQHCERKRGKSEHRPTWCALLVKGCQRRQETKREREKRKSRPPLEVELD